MIEPAPATPRVHHLPASPSTVRVGVIDPAAPPVLSIHPGDDVIFSTWGHWGGLVTRHTTIADFPHIRSKFPDALGPHSITGPVYVEGAVPGDALAVEVKDLIPADHGFNLVVASPNGRGVLRERFVHGTIRHFELDRRTMTTTLAERVQVRLRPFLGIMGVAPAEPGARSSVQPGVFGGNIDLSELVAGTTLLLPVFREGAGFYCGDAHAAQGDGEVNQTAIETAMERAHLGFSLVKGANLTTPRALTATHRISLGFGDTLEQAAHDAIADPTEWLTTDGLNPDEAYSLCSIAADVKVTQMVNGVVGVHAMIQHFDALRP